jgi:predicted N-acetyltransferase YhbS
MDIRIRKMAPADLPAASGILAQWNMAPTPEIPDAERSGIAVENSFVAEDGGRIIGVSSWIDHSGGLGETASLAVDRTYRGKGVGEGLQRARIEEMRARGIRRVRTEADRPETIRWYVDKFGYQIVGTNPKKHDFSLPDVDCWTVLELDLARELERGASPKDPVVR